jgi:hypothetical protein
MNESIEIERVSDCVGSNGGTVVEHLLWKVPGRKSSWTNAGLVLHGVERKLDDLESACSD